MSATEITHTAIVAPSGHTVAVTIRRAISAGIDGPVGGFTLRHGATMDDVADELARRGYAVASAWSACVAYDGLHLEANLGPKW